MRIAALRDMAAIIDFAGLERRVVRPTQAPTEREVLKFPESSTAAVNDLAITAPMPGADMSKRHDALSRAEAISCVCVAGRDRRPVPRF